MIGQTQRRPILVRIEGVASNFRSDWQYLIAASRINSALSLVTLFSVLAVVVKFADLMSLGSVALYMLIASSITYSVALAIIKFRAPKFLQDYQNYKDYEDRKNSHRWILWEFYHNLTNLKRGFSLLLESIDKQISFESSEVDVDQCPIVPIDGGKRVKGVITVSLPGSPETTYNMVAFKPVNFERDLVMAFTTEKDRVLKHYVLPVREDDEKCEAKCKELFWIIFSEAAKENTLSRRVAWSLIGMSAVLFFASLFLAVFHSLVKGEAPSPSLFHYI